MEWILIFMLAGGEVAELPASKEQCDRALGIAAAHGGIAVNLTGRQRQIIPAWDVACVQREAIPARFSRTGLVSNQ